MAENVNINPDGSTTFEGGESTMPPGAEDAGADGTEGVFEETMEEVVKGGDPAIYLVLVAILLGLLYFVYKRKSRDDEDEFFSNLDGGKVSPAGLIVTSSIRWIETYILFLSFSSTLNFLLKLMSTMLSRTNA